MLSTLLSLPASALSSTASFLTARRRGFAYAAGAIGGAYLAGRWALEKVGESAERARKEGWGRDDLARRFSLNLQDSQFTVVALLPTLQAQVGAELDVEARTRELAERARAEREKKAREVKREEEERVRGEREREEEERLRRETESRAEVEQQQQQQQGEEPSVAPDESISGTQDASSPSSSAPSAAANEPSPTPADPSSSSSLDPTAPSFVFNPSAPAFAPAPSSDAASFVDGAPATAQEEGAFPPLPGASASETVTEGQAPQPENGHETGEEGKANGVADGEDSGEGVGEGEGQTKSWAAVVQNGVDVQAGTGEKPPTPPTDPDTPPPTAPPSSAPNSSPPNGDAAPSAEANVDAQEPVEEEGKENPLAGKSKAELWHEIKILAFTRLLTSLYLLPLLTLQTHVQLALLGRSSYVDSLVSALPPRTPSPPPAGHKPLPPLPSSSLPNGTTTDDVDLEKALLQAREVPLTAKEKAAQREEERQDVERKYLTFSWWLLHEGWRVVEQRVRGAVEEVLGPMGLKAPLVYGELGALFGQLRRRIELDEATGKAFDFSPALHPPTAQLELQTLISGGSYVPPPPSPPLPSSSSSYPPSPYPPTSTPSSATATAAPTDPISPALRHLLSETSDALDSPDAALVRALMLDRLFALVIEKLEPSFRSSVSPSTAAGGERERGARFEDVTEKTARVAAVLPVLTRLTAAGEGGAGVLGTGLEGSEWVEALEDVRELREFSAVLYGSWDREDLLAAVV
ncbi:hypothetical protein JCM6882_001085 [Rhodosporidiobolus microsporus]